MAQQELPVKKGHSSHTHPSTFPARRVFHHSIFVTEILTFLPLKLCCDWIYATEFFFAWLNFLANWDRACFYFTMTGQFFVSGNLHGGSVVASYPFDDHPKGNDWNSLYSACKYSHDPNKRVLDISMSEWVLCTSFAGPYLLFHVIRAFFLVSASK